MLSLPLFIGLPQKLPSENVPPVKKSRFKLAQEKAAAVKKEHAETSEDPEEMIDSKERSKIRVPLIH